MTTAHFNPGSTPPLAGRMKWLLIGSLALNLLVAGAAIGMFTKHRRTAAGADLNVVRLVANDHGVQKFFRTLGPDREAAFRPILDDRRQTLVPLRVAARAARRDAAASLAAEPFDAARFKSAMEGLQAAEAAANRSAVSLLTTALEKMTPEERARFTAWRLRFERWKPGGGPMPPEPK
jgi:uncharacterized membrane protein